MKTQENSPSPFVHPHKKYKGNERAKPLSKEFFAELIRLEADFYNKRYNIITLDDLIQFYAKAVEYYDSVKDEISSYFIFKIQDILATKKSLQLLTQERQNKVNNEVEIKIIPPEEEKHKRKVTFEVIEESSDEEKTEEIFERRISIREEKKTRMSISMMKNEKQRFVNHFYKIETLKVGEKQVMNNVLNEFEEKSTMNDAYVKKGLDGQKERLRQRLNNRKDEIFFSHPNTPASKKTFSMFSMESLDKKKHKFSMNFLEVLNYSEQGESSENRSSRSGIESNNDLSKSETNEKDEEPPNKVLNSPGSKGSTHEGDGSFERSEKKQSQTGVDLGASSSSQFQI